MDLVVQHETFSRCRAAVVRAADELDAQHGAIDARVRGFLGAGWSGAAADAFHDAWDDWRAGAADVGRGLTAMAELLDVAQRGLAAQDESAGADLHRISARVLDRLG
jgi:WXG100 family type VII secretion target